MAGVYTRLDKSRVRTFACFWRTSVLGGRQAESGSSPLFQHFPLHRFIPTRRACVGCEHRTDRPIDMAFGHTRLDVRRAPQSSYFACSTTTVAVFVALCLVAVWMASSMLVTPAEFSPFQPKVHPLPPHDSPPATGSLTSVGQGDGIREMEWHVPVDPVSAGETTRDDPPPVTQQLPPVTDSMDGENQQEDVKEQVRKPDQQRASEQPEVFPDGSQAELFNETTTERGPWQTKAAQSNKDTKEQTLTSSSPAKKDVAWGKRSRVVLDVGCGVASFGGYLFDRDVITMSFAPKDEHESQVQFALERGIPAILAVMGTKRLPFPSRIFDVVHCARCRVPWHIEGGKLLLELDRLLRPSGYFVWSATPVYQKLPGDVEIWQAMSALTSSMCWKMVNKVKDRVNRVGIAIYRKPTDNSCYEARSETNPPLCGEYDDHDAAWNISLGTCMHKLPGDPTIRGSQWPELWPLRLEKPPYWLRGSEAGVYGKPAPEDFQADYEHRKRVVSNSYMNGLGIDWSSVRNVMDMKAVYAGFAAALRDLKVWIMNVVPIDSPDTLPIIYERGLFGLYHDWCESFSTYPRTYDLLHANHLFSKVKKRCELLPVIVEVDRVLRPEGQLIVRDNIETISEVENIVKSLHWEVRMSYSQDKEGYPNTKLLGEFYWGTGGDALMLEGPLFLGGICVGVELFFEVVSLFPFYFGMSIDFVELV